ncbi:copper homeostasis protein CutC [Fodinibius halophilus]|uniref:PF03932 family protein CutC n=1 Tax=Fodinibius halophilus TaxID=1736908 RepID=A0A6M1T4D3_9BACT|nr:copper homeostasis protein CutC [Fodinibius halophilus]
MDSRLTTEIVAYNIESALNAQAGGADRIELCDNPSGGGTTPSVGTVELLREKLDIPIFVMIRPREGDFCYSDLEFEAMKRDISHCKDRGADGVVFGILSPDGSLDFDRCKELIELARPLQVTCHRAFDMTSDPFEALESCIEAGFDRILTSGQQTCAHEGIATIAELVERAGNRISMMAGCGVNEDTVQKIIEETDVREIHFSAKDDRPSKMKYRNKAINGMGDKSGKEYSIRIASQNRVARICQMALAADSSVSS